MIGEGQLVDVKQAVEDSVRAGRPWQVLISQTIMSQARCAEPPTGAGRWRRGGGRSSCSGARLGLHARRTRGLLPPPLHCCVSIKNAPPQIKAPKLLETVDLQPKLLRKLCRQAARPAACTAACCRHGACRCACPPEAPPTIALPPARGRAGEHWASRWTKRRRGRRARSRCACSVAHCRGASGSAAPAHPAGNPAAPDLQARMYLAMGKFGVVRPATRGLACSSSSSSGSDTAGQRHPLCRTEPAPGALPPPLLEPRSL